MGTAEAHGVSAEEDSPASRQIHGLDDEDLARSLVLEQQVLELVRDDVRRNKSILKSRVNEDHRPELFEEQVFLHNVMNAREMANELLSWSAIEHLLGYVGCLLPIDVARAAVALTHLQP